MGLLVSGSHDSGEIACEIACNLLVLIAGILLVGCDVRLGDAGDEAISESYKCMDLLPVDGSSVFFFLFKAISAFFPLFYFCFLTR